MKRFKARLTRTDSATRGAGEWKMEMLPTERTTAFFDHGMPDAVAVTAVASTSATSRLRCLT